MAGIETVIDCLIYLDETTVSRFNELVAPCHRHKTSISDVPQWYRVVLYDEEATAVFLVFKHLAAQRMPPYFREMLGDIHEY